MIEALQKLLDGADSHAAEALFLFLSSMA